MNKTKLTVLAFAACFISVAAQSQTEQPYASEQEKVEWIEKNPEAYQNQLEEMKGEKKEQFSSDDEKAAWIEANPEAYQSQLEEMKANREANQAQVAPQPANKEEFFGSDEEKAAWIEANPEAYQKLINGETTLEIEALKSEIEANRTNPEYPLAAKEAKLNGAIAALKK